MPSLTCPNPTNINPLSPNGFMFSIERLKELTYFCQSASIPQLSLGSSTQSNPFTDINLPGDKLEFSPLEIRFVIDEEMKNFIAVHNWITSLGFPNGHFQYSDFLSDQPQNLSESSKVVSDGTLTILNHKFLPVKSLKFLDLFPVSLSSVDFQSTNTDVPPVIGVASFLYTSYEFSV